MISGSASLRDAAITSSNWRDVAAHHLDQVAERGGRRVDVHADDLFAARDQQRDQSPADEAGPADDKRLHAHSLPAGCLRARRDHEGTLVPPEAAVQAGATA